jgi:hypothetical protein
MGDKVCGRIEATGSKAVLAPPAVPVSGPRALADVSAGGEAIHRLSS